MIVVLGPGAESEPLLDAVDVPLQSASVEDVAETDPDAVVTIGESTVTDLVHAAPDLSAPVLLVDHDVSRGLPTATLDDAADAVTRLASGDYFTSAHPLLRARTDGECLGHAVFDAMLVTGDPAQISEYSIATREDSGTSGRGAEPDEIGRVRADGIVVATPAGSHEYAHAAGGPRIETTASVAAVVPVAAFTMEPERWIVDLDGGVEITGERDISASLLLDDERRTFPGDRTVTFDTGGSIEFVDVDGRP